MNFSYITEKDDYLSGTHWMYQSNANGVNGRPMTDNELTEGNIAKKQVHDYDLEEPNDGNENVGKKSKEVTEGGFLQQLRAKILGLFSLFIFCVGAFSAVFLYLILQSTINLQLVLQNGDVFMNGFNDNIMIMIAIKEKTLDSKNYDDYFKKNIQNLLDSYTSNNMQPHMDTLSFMDFDEFFNIVYYSNPCENLSDLLTESSTTVPECISVAQGSLQKGVASFNSFYKNAVNSFVNNGIDSQELDNSIIFDYNRGIYYANLFQVSLVQVWSSNTDSYLSSQLQLIVGFVSIMLIILFVVYLIIAEQLLIGRFNKEYSYFRTIYNMYMPDIIILKEKRIKFWLVKHFVINK